MFWESERLLFAPEAQPTEASKDQYFVEMSSQRSYADISVPGKTQMVTTEQ